MRSLLFSSLLFSSLLLLSQYSQASTSASTSYNIDITGRKNSNYKPKEELDDGFKDIKALYKYLSGSYGGRGNFVTETALDNLFTAGYGRAFSKDFSKDFGGINKKIDTIPKFTKALQWIEDNTPNNVFDLFQSDVDLDDPVIHGPLPAPAPPRFPTRNTIARTPTVAFDFITFDSEADIKLGQVNTNRIRGFLEQMWYDDIDFKRLIEALRQNYSNGYNIDIGKLPLIHGPYGVGTASGNKIEILDTVFNERSVGTANQKNSLKGIFIHEMLHSLGYAHETIGKRQGIQTDNGQNSSIVTDSYDGNDDGITIQDYLNGNL